MAGRLRAIPRALEGLGAIWRYFFPVDVFSPGDIRLGSIAVFLEDMETDWTVIHAGIDLSSRTVIIDVERLLITTSFEDLRNILRQQPREVMGCMVSLIMIHICHGAADELPT